MESEGRMLRDNHHPIPSQPTEGCHSCHCTSLTTTAQWETSWGWKTGETQKGGATHKGQTEAQRKTEQLQPQASQRGRCIDKNGLLADGPVHLPQSVLQLLGGAYKPGLCKDFSAIKFLFEMKLYAVGEAFLCQTLNPEGIQ